MAMEIMAREKKMYNQIMPLLKKAGIKKESRHQRATNLAAWLSNPEILGEHSKVILSHPKAHLILQDLTPWNAAWLRKYAGFENYAKRVFKHPDAPKILREMHINDEENLIRMLDET